MERIINKIIGAVKKKYFIITFVFILLISVLGGSYSYWSMEAGWQLASELTFNDLTYSVTIDGVSGTTITSAANSNTVYYDIAVTSLNDLNTKYLLTFNSTVAEVTVEVSSLSINNANGIIGKYESGTGAGKTKTIRLAVTNTTANIATITLNPLGGYTWNTSASIDIPEGYSAVTGYKEETAQIFGLTLAQEVNQTLSCTPTASVPCLYDGNSNNYLSYGGQTWRILGSYIIGEENVVKLILDGHLTSSSNYSGVSSALSTFYSGLTDTSLIRTSSPFTCTGTSTISCTGSANIGLLSKSEYDLIGGVNSYLYAKPTEFYWTNTESSSGVYNIGTNRGASTLSSSETAYIRPTIYLISGVIRDPNTSGTQSSPHLIDTGNYLTVTGTYGTTKFGSGYYSVNFEYIDNAPPIRTNYILRDYVVTGSGTSISNYTLSMGENNSTLNVRWWALYSITYNCNGKLGSTETSNHVEGSSQNLSANGCWGIIEGTSGGIYTFKGWDTNSAATVPTYTDEQSVLDLTTVGGTVINLYAIWGSNIFTYSQSYNVISEGSGNWRIEYKTVGTNNLVVSEDIAIDAFLLGGGGGGAHGSGAYRGGGGGGGGYATTEVNIGLTSAASPYSIVIGDGGTAALAANAGGTTTAFGFSATGGGGGGGGADNRNGGNGASGGGRGTYSSSYPKPGNGGTDGSNGLPGTGYGSVGNGQLTTTRSFKESTGTLYSGGGGGGGYNSSGSSASSGGAGGGGGGGWYGGGTAGTANTGGGGGGGGCTDKAGGKGGSGILIIRNARIINVGDTYKYSFTYSGTYEVTTPTTDTWKLRLLSSGTLTMVSGSPVIDAFLVGGGGGGSSAGSSSLGGGGGGGGYTLTQSSVSLTQASTYSIVVGLGGTANNSGAATTGFGYTANPGTSTGSSGRTGAAGGSGGGGAGGGDSNSGGNGGSNGSNGYAGQYSAGSGQTTTTREFGETGATLYAGGGGGGNCEWGGYSGTGGAGGGGNGAWPTGGKGTANTGGGGGGGSGYNGSGGAGGSGIIVIRKH